MVPRLAEGSHPRTRRGSPTSPILSGGALLVSRRASHFALTSARTLRDPLTLASALILLLSSALLLNDLSLWHAKRRHASDALVNAGFVQFDRRGELPRTHKPGRRRAPRSEESEPQAVWWTGGAGPSEWDVDTIERSLIRQGGWNGRGSDGRVRILFLVSYQDYLTRMNTHTPELISASLAHPYVETDVWGPGWGGWDESQTISWNLARRRRRGAAEGGGVGPGYFDLVWTISDIFPVDSPALDNPLHGTLFAQQLGDCHSDDCIRKFYAPHLNITVVKYPHELADMLYYDRVSDRFPDMEMQLFSVSSDSANRWDYYPPESWEDKTVDAQGFGYGGSFYPIRQRVLDCAAEGRLISWFSHPGYNIPGDNESDRPEFYDDDSPLHTDHRQKRQEFAAAMRQTKICVFDSSLERKAIRKFAQAFLSGCVVASDLPTDGEEYLKEFVIELKQGWSLKKIDSVIANALKDPQELQRKAIKALAYARTHLTNTAKVEGMLELWERHKLGWRGYVFPRGHSLRCRQYWSGDDSFRPKWCTSDMDLEGVWDREHEWT